MRERGKFSTLLGQGFIDTYRYFYPDPGRNLFLVVLSFPGKEEKCRMAY